MNPSSLTTFDPAIFAVKALAVVGGAVLGGLCCGGATRFLVKRIATEKLTEKFRWLMRGVGGVFFGWITALALFGGGGGYGLGGTGGWGFGGTGAGAGAQNSNGAPPRKDKADDKQPTRPTMLEIEVLGPPALSRLYSERHEADRCYRVEADGAVQLLNLVDLKVLVGQRLKADPPLGRVEIVLYKDSPEGRTPRVAELQRWLQDLAAADQGALKIDRREPDGPAPMR